MLVQRERFVLKEEKRVKFLFFYDFRWFIDNEIVPGNHGTSLKLKKVGRESNNKIVKCEVNNVIGKSEETETLDIHCKNTLSLIQRFLL